MTEPAEPGWIDGLLEPFVGDPPSGVDLRHDVSPQSLYFRLRDARAEARAAERLADNDPDLGGASPPQWSSVHELAIDALASQSKDLEIACWLTEALTRRDGLAGLANGVTIIVGLIDGFWDRGMFPAPDPDDPEGRLIAITGMSGQERDGSLLQPLRKLTLFTPPRRHAGHALGLRALQGICRSRRARREGTAYHHRHHTICRPGGGGAWRWQRIAAGAGPGRFARRGHLAPIGKCHRPCRGEGWGYGHRARARTA